MGKLPGRFLICVDSAWAFRGVQGGRNQASTRARCHTEATGFLGGSNTSGQQHFFAPKETMPANAGPTLIGSLKARKMVLLGDTGVGKSSLLSSLLDPLRTVSGPPVTPTIGVDFMVRTQTLRKQGARPRPCAVASLYCRLRNRLSVSEFFGNFLYDFFFDDGF